MADLAFQGGGPTAVGQESFPEELSEQPQGLGDLSAGLNLGLPEGLELGLTEEFDLLEQSLAVEPPAPQFAEQLSAEALLAELSNPEPFDLGGPAVKSPTEALVFDLSGEIGEHDTAPLELPADFGLAPPIDELASPEPEQIAPEQEPLFEGEEGFEELTQQLSEEIAKAVEPSSLHTIIPPNADLVWAREAVLSLADEYVESNRTPVKGAWFSELFRGEYRLAHPFRSLEPSKAEIDFIEGGLNVAAGGRLLDLGCGDGRHAIPLARRGYEMVGLDLSIEMLELALGRAQDEDLSIKFVHGDMRDLNFSGVFDGAYCFETSFGFFSEVENLTVLRGLHRSLKSGGRLLLDMANRDQLLLEMPRRNYWEGDGCLIQEDIEFNHRTSRLLVKRYYLIFADGAERAYEISVRIYSLHEVIRMLELVGFEVFEVSGDVHTRGAFFGSTSPRLIIAAQKV